MIELNESQLGKIEDILQHKLITAPYLKGEIIDHICCAVEGYMEAGHDFEAALSLSVQSFGKNGIKQTASRVSRTRKWARWKKEPLAWLSPAMAICLLFIVVNVGAKDRPDRKPTNEDFRIVSGFGAKQQNVHHNGIDIKMPVGTAIVATADGIVEKVTTDNDGYGLYVLIRHDGNYQTSYAHLSEVEVSEGMEVLKGQLIARSGNSGKSTGPHLHYEVIHNGRHVDPAAYLGTTK